MNTNVKEPKAKKSPFSATALQAIAKAQAENPGKGLEELTEEVAAAYEELKAKSKGVNGDAYTRATAIAEILKVAPSKDKDAVIAEADAVYCEKTGRTSNVRETTFTFAHVYHTLLVFGLVGAAAPAAPAEPVKPKK